MGIAQTAVEAPPLPHSTIRARVQTPQNQAISSQKSFPKPSGQGLRPTPPYGNAHWHCPNAFCANLKGASLSPNGVRPLSPNGGVPLSFPQVDLSTSRLGHCAFAILCGKCALYKIRKISWTKFSTVDEYVKTTLHVAQSPHHGSTVSRSQGQAGEHLAWSQAPA